MEPIKNRYEFVIFFDVENGNPNGDPDSFADTFVFSSSEILSDKSREGISEILNRHICKRVYFYSCRKSRHNSRTETVYQSLYHKYSEIHNRLL